MSGTTTIGAEKAVMHVVEGVATKAASASREVLAGTRATGTKPGQWAEGGQGAQPEVVGRSPTAHA